MRLVLAVLGGLVALALIGGVARGGEPEADLEVPADYDPPLIDGVALYESPVRYTVQLEVQAECRDAIALSFTQDNVTRDRFKLGRIPAGGTRTRLDDLEALDAYYRPWGFKPIGHGEKITPRWMKDAYDLGENTPTFRQFCGGFALAPLLGALLRAHARCVSSRGGHREQDGRARSLGQSSCFTRDRRTEDRTTWGTSHCWRAWGRPA